MRRILYRCSQVAGWRQSKGYPQALEIADSDFYSFSYILRSTYRGI